MHPEQVRAKRLPVLLGIAGIVALVGFFSYSYYEQTYNDAGTKGAHPGTKAPANVHDGQAYSGVWYPQQDASPPDMQQAGSGGYTAQPSSASVKLATEGASGAFEAASMDQGAASADSAPGTIGFAVGGAQDIDNFRKNVENGFLPLYTDITYEGLFYDYYFDTANTQSCDKLFCPSYSSAVSRDPFSERDEYYLSVGLNSGMTESDFERKKLNLVLVLDVSGSMGSPFDQYHYDQYGSSSSSKTASREGFEDDYTKSKMQVANESIVGLLDHLTGDDRLGVVLFDSSAHMAKPLESMAETDRDSLKRHIMEIYADGGTNMASGISLGTTLFDRVPESDRPEYENRMIFLTDAMPNTGEIRRGGLFDMIARNAERDIYTTLIGVGVDFNTELVEHITKVKGANYYSVHSSSEFRERMGDEFEFMVTPLVFDLTLNMESDGYKIKNVYGSPESAQATGQIMRVNTLFPSKVTDGETRGGIVLIELEKLSEDATIGLSTSYENRAGQKDGDAVVVDFGDETNHYQNTGIHKGVLLTRYADLMKAWAYDQRSSLARDVMPIPAYLDEDGISVPEHVGNPLGVWERQSVPLDVSGQYGDAISEFNGYFQEELVKIGDFELLQEVTLMQKLESFA